MLLCVINVLRQPISFSQVRSLEWYSWISSLSPTTILICVGNGCLRQNVTFSNGHIFSLRTPSASYCFYWLAATITIHLRYRKSLKSLWFRISGVAKIRFFYVQASINTSILIDSTLKKWLNYLQHSLSQADKSLGRFGLHHDSFSLCGGYFAFERVFVFFSGPRKRKPQKRKPGHSHFLISYSINSYIPHLYTFNTSYPLYNKLFLLRFIILYIYFYFKFSSSLKLRHYNIYFIP